MQSPAAIVSMIHENAEQNSATRLFRGEPVLAWTLRRLQRSRLIDHIVVICWDDQLQAVEPLAAAHGANVMVKEPRASLPAVQRIAVARQWCDQARGPWLSACDFDLGFHGPWVKEAVISAEADGAVLVNPSAGLVDTGILDALMERASQSGRLTCSRAPAGLAGAVVPKPVLEDLSANGSFPGAFHDIDDELPLPPIVSRCTSSFKIDSYRQSTRLTQAMISLNGTLVRSDAELLVARLEAQPQTNFFPREVMLELTTTRSTIPTFISPQKQSGTPQLSESAAAGVIHECAKLDDVRLVLGGTGDPLLWPSVIELVDAARCAGVSSIRIETDLLEVSQNTCERLADSLVDIVSVHLPAHEASTYRDVMRVDGFDSVVRNISTFETHQQEHARSMPLLIPIFTPTRENRDAQVAWRQECPHGLIATDLGEPFRLSVLAGGQIVYRGQILGYLGQSTLSQAWASRQLVAA